MHLTLSIYYSPGEGTDFATETICSAAVKEPSNMTLAEYLQKHVGILEKAETDYEVELQVEIDQDEVFISFLEGPKGDHEDVDMIECIRNDILENLEMAGFIVTEKITAFREFRDISESVTGVDFGMLQAPKGRLLN